MAAQARTSLVTLQTSRYFCFYGLSHLRENVAALHHYLARRKESLKAVGKVVHESVIARADVAPTASPGQLSPRRQPHISLRPPITTSSWCQNMTFPVMVKYRDGNV